VFLYNYLPGHDFGLAIIVLTIVIKTALYPTSIKAIKSQKSLQKLQPQMQEIQKKYKDDKEKQAKETLALYKKEKINPGDLVKSPQGYIGLVLRPYQGILSDGVHRPHYDFFDDCWCIYWFCGLFSSPETTIWSESNLEKL
jgi:YidC/Oxa1 family membrane protein insertase